MDVILMLVVLELLILYWYFHLIWISSILFLLYLVFKFFDGDEKTGNRSWGTIRRLLSFTHAYKWISGGKMESQRLLFIIIGKNYTNMGLFHGFGLHGGRFSNDLCFMLPKHLFYIPFVRDILLWCGAISDATDPIELLDRGKSLCYAPRGMTDLVYDDSSLEHLNDVFAFAYDKGIKVVPVYIEGEKARYCILQIPLIQRWTFSRLKGWPFPFFFWLRLKPAKIEIRVGVPMNPKLYISADKYQEAFLNQLCG